MRVHNVWRSSGRRKRFSIPPSVSILASTTALSPTLSPTQWLTQWLTSAGVSGRWQRRGLPSPGVSSAALFTPGGSDVLKSPNQEWAASDCVTSERCLFAQQWEQWDGAARLVMRPVAMRIVCCNPFSPGGRTPTPTDDDRSSQQSTVARDAAPHSLHAPKRPQRSISQCLQPLKFSCLPNSGVGVNVHVKAPRWARCRLAPDAFD